MSRLYPNIVYVALRNILTRSYPLSTRLLSTVATTTKLKDYCDKTKPSIRTLLPSTTPNTLHPKRPPYPVSDGTTTFTSMSSRLFKKKLWPQRLSTRLLLSMKLTTPRRRITGLKSCLPRRWMNSLAVVALVRLRVAGFTRLVNMKVVRHLIQMTWKMLGGRRGLVADSKMGLDKRPFVEY